MHCRPLLFFVALLVTALVAGCAEQPATVSGVVTLDGEPVTITGSRQGTIVFHPEDGGPLATGSIREGGEYTVAAGSSAAIPPGEYRVAVRVVEIVQSAGGTEPIGRSLSPSIYADPGTSGLRFTVVPGENRCDLPMKSAAGLSVAGGANEESLSENASPPQDEEAGL